MRSKIRCLIVSSRKEPFATLESVLAALPVKSERAQTFEEAKRLLTGPAPAHLVWTDAALVDGDWSDIVRLASESKEKINVVVQSPQADIGLYLEAMNHGAFDFVTESFTVPELVHVLRTAIEDSTRRRGNPKPNGAPTSAPLTNLGF